MHGHPTIWGETQHRDLKVGPTDHHTAFDAAKAVAVISVATPIAGTWRPPCSPVPGIAPRFPAQIERVDVENLDLLCTSENPGARKRIDGLSVDV